MTTSARQLIKSTWRFPRFVKIAEEARELKVMVGDSAGQRLQKQRELLLSVATDAKPQAGQSCCNYQSEPISQFYYVSLSFLNQDLEMVPGWKAYGHDWTCIDITISQSKFVTHCGHIMVHSLSQPISLVSSDIVERSEVISGYNIKQHEWSGWSLDSGWTCISSSPWQTCSHEPRVSLLHLRWPRLVASSTKLIRERSSLTTRTL